MALSIYPCVWHNQTAQEAAHFYEHTLVDCKIIESNQMAVKISVFGKEILLLNGGNQFTPNPSFSFFLYSRTISTAKEMFDLLKLNGKVLMKFDRYPWADAYGWVEDKYHTSWQITWNKKYPQGGLIKPALMFTQNVHGKTMQAIEFYQQVFKDNELLQVIKYPDTAEPEIGKIMFAELELAGNSLLLMDGGPTHAFTFNEGTSLVLECNDQDEINYYWDQFTKEGEESMCGWCKDQFNISWQIIPKNFTSLIKTPQAVDAMFKMKKIEIQKLIDLN